MILVDSSVWIEHFRFSEPMFAQFDADEQLLIHPFVLGEISLGRYENRRVLLKWLGKLMPAVQASDAEVMRLIESQPLFGKGIGYIDAHLLASVRLTSGARLWTRDRRLKAVAEEMEIATIADTRH